MEFLRKDVRDIFTKEFPYIETKAKDEPPVKYNKGAKVINSLIGSGSIFNGVAENSVIFRKVYTAERSYIKDSIIMEGCKIGKDCIIEYAILDKEVEVSDGKIIKGISAMEPIVFKKGTKI